MISTDAFFAAERVKWRKSWLLVVAVLAPLCQVGFLAIIFWFSDSRIRMFKPGFQFWLELNFVAWCLVVLPIATALICDLSWEQEREARAWNLLLIQPTPRRTHYLVKFLSHVYLVLLSQALFAVTLPLLGALLATNPKLLMGPLPLALLVRFLGFTVLASMALVAFHTWVSMRVSGIWMAVGIALAGSWFALRLVGTTAFIQVLPWGLAAQMSLVFERWRVLPWAQAPVSLLLAGALLILGTVDFSRHHESRT
ncbi:MAG: ABC transporter permease [Holophagaceae bacterium]|uniref:ABC transporter permease n=1 Tax=Candidatus Geothrix skivensis TaxID=2954439 RepID=A0A9D7SLD9_9BACT|nr:ABC transporter permease [Candidatus Geothrix skivensis]